MNPSRAMDDSRPSADRPLVEAFLQGRSEQAFRALYREHTSRFYQFALRLTRWDDAEAEELVQETWVRVVRALDRFEWRSSFTTWAMGIMLNLQRERARRGAARPSLVAVPAAEDAGGHSLPAGASHLDLEAAIMRLPSRLRETLLLHDVEGFTHEEIAAALEIRPGTSKSRLFEARQALRDRLAGTGSRSGGGTHE